MEKSGDHFSWSKFYSYREQIRNKYPSVYSIKIKKKLLDIIVGEVKDRAKVLDVGAYKRELCERIKLRFPSITCKTMDIDKAQFHDYYSLDEISETFDIIILSEVIEHFEFKEGISVLHKLSGLLNIGSKIIVSTPNINHPNRYWDSDHKTPYRYDEIGGALLAVGFNIDKIFRTYNDQFFKRLFRMYIASHLHKYLDVDFAKSIVIVATKK